MADWTNVETSMPPPGGQAVPVRPDELSASWLTGCLRHAGVLAASERVASFERTVIGQGRGFAGRIVRVTLTYVPATAQAPRSLIAKFTSDHAPTREMMSALEGYVREVRFYRELAPEIGVPTPRCYFAHYDQQQVRCCLLLEDLAPAASVERTQGFTLEQVKQLLEHLAVMHARYWRRADELPWLLLDERVLGLVIERFANSVPRFTERFGGAYPEMAKIAQLMLAFLGDDVRQQVLKPPLTLTHNDLHIENVMLPTPEGGRFAIIDWQGLSFTRHGTSDVSRAICVGLRPELRRKHVRELLDHYHRALVAQGVRGFSRTALGLRYRQEMVAMVMIGVLAFDTLDFGESGQETATLLATRIELALREARVGWLLRVMLVWLKLVRAVRWLLRAGAPPRLPG